MCDTVRAQRRQLGEVEKMLHAQAGFERHRVGEVAGNKHCSAATLRERYSGLQMQLEHRLYPRVHAGGLCPPRRRQGDLPAAMRASG